MKDNDILDEPGPVEDDGDIINRRKLLDNKLSNYKQKNLRKRLPSVDIAAQELEFKKNILQQLEDLEKAMQDSLEKMSDNMDKLPGAILTGFSMLRQVMTPQLVALPLQQRGYQACPSTTPHNGYFQPAALTSPTCHQGQTCQMQIYQNQIMVISTAFDCMQYYTLCNIYKVGDSDSH